MSDAPSRLMHRRRPLILLAVLVAVTLMAMVAVALLGGRELPSAALITLVPGLREGPGA